MAQEVGQNDVKDGFDERAGGIIANDGVLKWVGICFSVAIVLGVAYFLFRVVSFSDPQLLIQLVPRFIDAYLMVLFIVLVSGILSLVGAVPVALGRNSNVRFIHGVSTMYTEFFRGAPLLFLLLLVYIGIPAFWPPGEFPFSNWALPTAIICVTLMHAGYLGEALKGGIDSVSDGQMEAARSLGMSRTQAMIYVVLPQAARNALAAFTNDFIHLIKGTSVMTVIAVPEIISTFRNANAEYFDPWTPLILVAICYLGLTIPLGMLYRRLQHKYDWSATNV